MYTKPRKLRLNQEAWQFLTLKPTGNLETNRNGSASGLHGGMQECVYKPKQKPKAMHTTKLSMHTPKPWSLKHHRGHESYPKSLMRDYSIKSFLTTSNRNHITKSVLIAAAITTGINPIISVHEIHKRRERQSRKDIKGHGRSPNPRRTQVRETGAAGVIRLNIYHPSSTGRSWGSVLPSCINRWAV